jgi:ABC-type nitrate/sulfonate/bicarbonate transport system substrate-binding protein
VEHGSTILNRRAFGALIAAAAGAPLLHPALALAQTAPALGSASLGWVKSTANLLAPVGTTIAPTYGLTIESSNFNTAQDILTAMIAGQIDIGLLTPIHLIRSIDSGLDFVQIAGNARGGTGIVATKTINLPKDGWAALKKIASTRKIKVASSRGSVNEALAIGEFKKNGFDFATEVDLSNIPNFAEHTQALRSGEFDMIVTIEPIASLAVTQGVGTLFNYPYDTVAGNLNTNFVVSRKWLTANAPKVQAFVNALRDAQKKLSGDAAFRMAQAAQLTGLPAPVLTMALGNTTFDLDNGLAQTQALAKIALAEKYVAKDVSSMVAAHMDDRFLKTAKAV